MADKEKKNLLQKLLDKNEQGAEMMRRFVAEKALGMEKPKDQPVTSEDIAEGTYSKIPEGYRQAVQDLDKRLGTPILEPLAKTAVATASEMVSPLDLALMGAGGAAGKLLGRGAAKVASKSEDTAKAAQEAMRAYKARKMMQQLEEAANAKRMAEMENKFAKFKPGQVDPGVDNAFANRMREMQAIQDMQRGQDMIRRQTMSPEDIKAWKERVQEAFKTAPDDALEAQKKQWVEAAKQEIKDADTYVLDDETTNITDILKKKKK